MDPKSFWIAIAGMASTLVASGVALYFSHRARTQPYRELIYARQLDLIIELLAAASDFHLHAANLVAATSAEASRASWAALHVRFLRATELTPRTMAMLPAGLHESWSDLHTFTSLFLQSATERDPQPEAVAGLEARIAKLLGVSRGYLGVDALSEESARLFGDQDLRRFASISADELMKSLTPWLERKSD